MSDVIEAVRQRYAEKAVQMARGAACCDSSCCSDMECSDGYSSEELTAIGIDPSSSLGCGNPTLLADLKRGEHVLDLGSGAGLDVLLSARRVGPDGHAYGVDMTDEMLAVARENQAKARVANATFLKGTIEAIPLPDASVDVVISNCVINLAADKAVVLREAYRVLRPGGRFAVADMVASRSCPPRSSDRLTSGPDASPGRSPSTSTPASSEMPGSPASTSRSRERFGSTAPTGRSPAHTSARERS